MASQSIRFTYTPQTLREVAVNVGLSPDPLNAASESVAVRSPQMPLQRSMRTLFLQHPDACKYRLKTVYDPMRSNAFTLTLL